MSASAPAAGQSDVPASARVGDRLSLRARLIAVVLLLLTVALLLTGAATLALLRGDLMGRVDAQLRAAADPQVLRMLTTGAQGWERNRAPSPYDITLLSADGSVQQHLSGTDRGNDSPDLSRLTAQRAENLSQKPFTVRSDVGGRQWRVLAIGVQVRDPGDGSVAPATLALALPLDDVRGPVAVLGLRLLLIGAVVVLTCGLLGLAAIRRAFRPLREVESVATAFGQGDTSRRVRNDEPTTEVGRLGASVNAMLDGIETTLAAREASEARMRRFVADASHELRTPVAAVRGFAELYRQGAVTDPADVARSFRRIEEESTRMGGLVEDLLLLARLDEQRPMRREPVDLLVLAGDAVHDALALAPGRTVRLTGLGGDPVPRPALTLGDDARLRQVLSNLLTNAVRHTPAGSPVEIGVGMADGWARWQVVDHGPGVDPAQAARIFERFYRADSSRQRGTGGGSGLGLAIVDAIARAHGGAARVVPTPGGGATFQVALPAAPSGVPGNVQGRSSARPVRSGEVGEVAGPPSRQ